MTNKKTKKLQEKQIFHKFLVGFAVTMVVLVVFSNWYPGVKNLLNAYIWTGIVFGFIVIVRRKMLRQLRFWQVLVPIFALHILFIWKEMSLIKSINIWLLFVPIIIEALLIQAIVQMLSQTIMARKDL